MIKSEILWSRFFIMKGWEGQRVFKEGYERVLFCLKYGGI